MQLPEIDTGSSDLYWGVEEYIISSPVLPLIRTASSQNPGILVLGGNPSLCVQAVGNDGTPSAQPGRQPQFVFVYFFPELEED